MSLINEPIETLVHFYSGSLKPFRFLWRGRAYPITDITTTYQTKDGGIKKLVFAVQSGPNLYELVYNTATHTWFLSQIST